ncbi:MAG: CvpA family protein [Caulobacteraceae bacterium]|nr:CvpA family protein [Caulobacteraceae bacterium]
MTLFDIIALLVLGVSGLVGLIRGALREVTTVVAFVLAVFLALFSLRFTGPIARGAVHPSWAGTAVAVVVVFLAAYVAFRVIGQGLTRSVHNTQVLGTAEASPFAVTSVARLADAVRRIGEDVWN